MITFPLFSSSRLFRIVVGEQGGDPIVMVMRNEDGRGIGTETLVGCIRHSSSSSSTFTSSSFFSYIFQLKTMIISEIYTFSFVFERKTTTIKKQHLPKDNV